MTLQKIALLGASLAALGLPAAAQAATAKSAHSSGVDMDARCMATGLIMTSSQDPRTHGMGAQTLTYFLGRIDGHASKGDLEARIATQIQAIQGDKQIQQTAAQTCVKIMEASFTALRPITDDLGKRFGHPAPAAPATPAAPAAPATPPAPAH